MTISVYFIGICTHMWWDEAHPRVVLVNATTGAIINGQKIGAHVPTLRIAAKDIATIDLDWPGTGNAIIEWPLEGARLSINAIPGAVVRDESYRRCMPSLRELTPDIGPPSLAAVEGEDPRLASSYFDLTGGTLSAGTIKDFGAVFSMLVAQTEEDPVLSIAAFGSEVPTLIPLRDGAEISIANLGQTEGQDGHFDFYLHYTLAASMLKVLRVPDGSADCPVNGSSATWPPGLRTVDAGCSNSAYP